MCVFWLQRQCRLDHMTVVARWAIEFAICERSLNAVTGPRPSAGSPHRRTKDGKRQWRFLPRLSRGSRESWRSLENSLRPGWLLGLSLWRQMALLPANARPLAKPFDHGREDVAPPADHRQTSMPKARVISNPPLCPMSIDPSPLPPSTCPAASSSTEGTAERWLAKCHTRRP